MAKTIVFQGIKRAKMNELLDWCRETFGEVDVENKRYTMHAFPLNLTNTRAGYHASYWFRDDEDAATFKLRWKPEEHEQKDYFV